MHPENYHFTKEHEWIHLEGDKGTIGITDYAQKQLGDIVYVELPKEGEVVQAGKPFGTVESVKSVSDLYAPLSGRVTKVNARLNDEPELINRDPYGQGWMIEIEVTNPDEAQRLMSLAEYQSLVGE